MQNAYQNLLSAISKLETPEQVDQFLKDIATPAEIDAFTERLQLAILLDQKTMSYRDISHMTGASTTTVARVARFLNHENHGGYRHVIKLMNIDKGQNNETTTQNISAKGRPPR